MNKPKNQILIVDDEPDIREVLELTLGRMNLETRSASNIDEARHLLKDYKFDLCLTDMRLPDGNGIELVRHIQDEHPYLPVAVITAFGNMETAVAALKAGAFDFVSKPLDLNDLRTIVRSALRVGQAQVVKTTTAVGSEPPETGTGAKKMLGESAAIEKVRTMIERLARGQAPVYIAGESGTGKELAARLIHELGPRADKPFVPVNCGAIPESLMESEFFGHKKGSFTGAVTDKDGLFKAADGGTLFLDEVGDLPLSMQVKLLRAIQEKSVRPVGAQSEFKVDVRILSATHKNLHDLVAQGKFRQDLYYRLNVIELVIPSLRERAEDIPLLAEALCRKLSENMGMKPPGLTLDATEALQRYAFAGNVRELENILERALTLCNGTEITAQDLQLQIPADNDEATVMGGKESLDNYLERVERATIEKALAQTSQNKTAAAKLLGISFRALRYKLEKLGIE
ncbi:MAG: sigma-54-dependent Fis family transcriptional regulator [Candidatus Muproteobacteria bacterium RIFCSPLOWO2_01_FULL_60_18]|uniref:Sigma-54-dependent Fis family transcriptional regulator n=1 Tax=Candidatus Muproteobacteria bacterium RIFCSPLOWO2_01_FULL_60_18 TaxID=1817768 RepID=A0A1F6U2J9_9PROT|nr:MAG: sigma-54-dependent Fis family transcriptional regulator [Candidatus Muproteobacteria bacterium RIFCSPLOWO2_01_FULL_60_18]